MHQRFEHIVDHSKMLMSLELLFHIDKVFVQRIEPARNQLADMQTDDRRRLQELARIPDHLK